MIIVTRGNLRYSACIIVKKFPQKVFGNPLFLLKLTYYLARNKLINLLACEERQKVQNKPR